ncbi:RNA polymerase sigma factor [Singulisphaera sp. PoT]|uniref:RNA polymerase sigma factor n=1 Tax=Singulisphaera sp. PoT TaxID=3411797 RepID=UPI003BF5D0EC
MESALPKDLDTLWRVGSVGGLSDGELLDRFLLGGDGADEVAFMALAARHGPMVLRVCRQILGDSDEAQDAFQATFLVFVRRAGAVRKRESLASWLHGVARRVARRALVDAARRRKHERLRAEKVMRERGDKGEVEAWPELHDAIARLPERYREPTVLCYLEGMTTEAAAHRIGCPQGTVLSRLARARERLRTSLSRHGAVVPSAFLTPALAVDPAPAAVPASLLVATVQASLIFAGRRSAVASLATTAPVILARGVLSTMTISKIKVLGAIGLAGLFAVGGARTYGQFGGMGGSAPIAPRISKDHGVRAAPRPNEGGDRAELARSLAALKDELSASKAENRRLRKQLQLIRDQLNSINLGGEEPNPDAANVDDAATKAEVALPPDSRFSPDGDTLLINAPKGNKPTGRERRKDKSQPVPLGTANMPTEARPIVGPGVVAMAISGPKITRIVATNNLKGTWIPFELREPVTTGSAMPIVAPGVAAYGLGRYVYAFSPEALKWDVLEVPEGINATPIVGPQTVTIEGKGHSFTFDASEAKWIHVNFNDVLNKVPKQGLGEPDAAKEGEKP